MQNANGDHCNLPDCGVAFGDETPRPNQPISFLKPREFLRWLYVGRMTLVSGILLGALLEWQPDTVFAFAIFGVALVATALSFWRTHLSQKPLSEVFLYAQVILDVLIVTAIVHITGGDQSDFAPMYILVISEGALLLPLPGGVLIGGLASVLYFADIVFFHEGTLTPALALQIGLFTMVAIVTGILGDRLRSAGIRLGAVESELEQLRLDTSEILDNLSTGIMTVDGSGRLVYLNPAGARLLGLEVDQWIGAPVLGTVEQIAPGLGNLMRRSMEDRTPVMRFKTKALPSHGAVTLGVSTTLLDRQEMGLPSATAIFQNITDLERIDTLDRRNQRLEAVAELSASLAHEIKNPLASIRSSVEQMARGDLDPADEALLQRLVLSESDRLSRLLSEFLEFSALRVGRVARLDLAEVARNAVRLARAHPDAPTGSKVEMDGTDVVCAIAGDEDLLHRAIYNLVLNALQFSGENGRVTVSLRPPAAVPPEASHIRAPVRLAVSDSGPGLDPDAIERIFNPFYTTRRGGSGLGLAVVHRAVEGHEGAVLAENRPEGGAMFALYLPRDGRDDTA